MSKNRILKWARVRARGDAYPAGDDQAGSLSRHPAFLQLWAADTSIDLARQSSGFILPLIGAVSLDASPFEMGALGAAATAPSLLISLVAGVWVDRLPRRVTMAVSSALRFALSASIPILWWIDLLTVSLLIGVGFLIGSMTLIFDLSRQAWLPSLVGRHRLAAANGRMNATRSAGQIAGPAVGGAMAGITAPPLATLVDAPASLLASLLSIRIQAGEPARSSLAPRQSVWRQALEGLRVTLRNRVLRATIGASAAAAFFGHVFIAVYVLYMASSLGLSSFEIGIVFAIGGLGAVIGSILAAPVAARYGVGRTIAVAWLLFGLGGLPIPLAILAPEYALELVVASEFLQWLVLPLAEVNQLSLRQAVTPDHYLGRIAASYRFIVNGMVPVGSLLGGALGTLIGLQATMLIGVAGMLGAFVWIAFSPVLAIGEHPSEPSEIAGAPGLGKL